MMIVPGVVLLIFLYTINNSHLHPKAVCLLPSEMQKCSVAWSGVLVFSRDCLKSQSFCYFLCLPLFIFTFYFEKGSWFLVMSSMQFPSGLWN
jgi:hypothetical protein